MHNRYIKIIPLLLCTVVFVVGVERVEAKNQDGGPWNYTDAKILYGFSGFGSVWAPALANPNITIAYSATAYDVNTGNSISDGAVVGVGQRIKFRFSPRLPQDIVWFGLGFAYDTPYGYWLSAAVAPTPTSGADAFGRPYNTCSGGDLYYTGSRSSLYAPLSVNPPTLSYSASSGLSCGAIDASENIYCDVIASGSLSNTLTFSSTYARFYFRYYSPSLGVCYGAQLPLSPVVGTDYTISVPLQTITFSLTAVSNNNPPTVPNITGPTTGTTNTPYSFSVVSTDPDNDTVRYGFDWDNNGSVDEWVPSSGFVNSGTSQSLSHSFPLAQKYTFQVFAEDSKGSQSGPATHDITLSLPALPTITTQPAVPVSTNSMTINGTGNPNGNATTGWFRYSTTNPGSCNDTFGIRVPASGGTALGAGTANTPFSQNLTSLTANTTYYFCAIGQSTGGIAYGTVLTAITTPDVPTGLTATPNATCGTGIIDVVWNTVAGATSYTLRDGATTIYSGGTAAYSHSSLPAASSHSYTVQANNTSGSSAWSGAVNADVVDACTGAVCSGTAPTTVGGETACGTADPTPDLLDGDDIYSIVDACSGSVSKCFYVCDSGNIQDGTNTDCRPPVCTGSAPTNATPCSTDSIGADFAHRVVPKTFSCVNKCDYRCNSGYILDGASCRLTECNDNSDNDGDGLNNFDDPGCHNDINDDDEDNVATNPKLKATPRDVTEGEEVLISWDTGGTPEDSCTITANGLPINPDPIASENTPLPDDVLLGSFTKTINVRTTFTMDCGGGHIDSVTVGVVVRGFES